MTGTDEPLLEINDLSSGYDGDQIVREVSLKINAGEIFRYCWTKRCWENDIS